MGRAFLIRIPRKKDRIRAIEILMDVREPYQVFPDNQWFISRAHFEALRQAGVAFEDLTDLPTEEENHQKARSVKPRSRS